jgi:hypothetical protein
LGLFWANFGLRRPKIGQFFFKPLFDNFHCKTPQADKLYCQLVAGHKKIILLIPFSTIFDTPGCCKTHLLNKKVSNLALEMWFLSVFFVI